MDIINIVSPLLLSPLDMYEELMEADAGSIEMAKPRSDSWLVEAPLSWTAH